MKICYNEKVKKCVIVAKNINKIEKYIYSQKSIPKVSTNTCMWYNENVMKIFFHKDIKPRTIGLIF